MKKIVVLVSVLMLAMLFVSCNMFTSSLGEGLARDLSKSLSDASTGEIVDLLNSGQALSGEDAKGVSNALAEKDPEELKELPLEDKSTIINTAAAGLIPSPDELLNKVDVDAVESMTDEEISTLVKDMIDSIDTDVNTGAIETFFNDTKEDENGKTTIENLLEESPDALVMGALALTAAIAKDAEDAGKLNDAKALQDSLEPTIQAIEDAIVDGTFQGDKKAIVEDLTAELGADEDQVDALASVIITVYEASEEPDGLESLGGLEDLLTGLLGIDVSTTLP